MLLKIIKINNGDTLVPFKLFKCDGCGCELRESWRMHTDGNFNLCRECAFKKGYWDSREYLDSCGISLDCFQAAVNPDGEIEVWTGGPVPPWERENGGRSSPKYTRWRVRVFERDGYTCQKCGRVGGELNAHHIKPFKSHKNLRYVVENGLTVCVECHRKIHSRGVI